jgi:hypothetical protein
MAPLVARAFDGYNGTVFAYGQTGSGKTHAMGTAFSDGAAVADGVVPRAVEDVFARKAALELAEDAALRCEVKLSLLEVYNEEVRDLLAELGTAAAPLPVREAAPGAGGGVTVTGLSEHVAAVPGDVHALLARGQLCRATESTNMNAHSSRSHMICTLRIEVIPDEATATATVADGATAPQSSSAVKHTVAKLHLVDLAGSERAKRTGATGKRLAEGIGINKSLLALGNVIAKLVESQEQQRAADAGAGEASTAEAHIPYVNKRALLLLLLLLSPLPAAHS